MRWTEGAPEKGDKERSCEQFAYTRPEHGLSKIQYGWCARKPYWCKAHEHTERERGTKVCVQWFTKGELDCPRCRPGCRISDIAYVPVWREWDTKPILLICHDSVADLLADLDFGVYVQFGRVGKDDGVFVKRAAEKKLFRSDLPYRQGPCDIAVSLLTIWKYPALVRWCRRTSGTGGVVSSEQTESGRWRLSVPPPTTATEALAADAERKAPVGDAAGIEDGLHRALRRAKDAERNGKHKPEG